MTGLIRRPLRALLLTLLLRLLALLLRLTALRASLLR